MGRPERVVLLLLMVLPALFYGCGGNEPLLPQGGEMIVLPEPQKDSDTSIEEALLARRSVREYREEPVTLEQISQLLWAAQGITSADGKRTAPSAGALYPLTVYIIIGSADGILPGVYRYDPEQHALYMTKTEDRRQALAEAALDQAWVKEAAIDIVITGKYKVITPKYGERGIRYTWIEAGHAAQNICLQAVGVELGAVTIGAFYDDEVQRLLGLSDDETPLYIIPVGVLAD